MNLKSELISAGLTHDTACSILTDVSRALEELLSRVGESALAVVASHLGLPVNVLEVTWEVPTGTFTCNPEYHLLPETADKAYDAAIADLSERTDEHILSWKVTLVRPGLPTKIRTDQGCRTLPAEEVSS